MVCVFSAIYFVFRFVVHGTEFNVTFCSWCSIWLLAILAFVCRFIIISSHFRLKNVIFEISPSETVGVFDVKAKLLGVHLETLQLQYQVGYPQDHLYYHLYFQTRPFLIKWI